jgi:hypothetical protein
MTWHFIIFLAVCVLLVAFVVGVWAIFEISRENKRTVGKTTPNVRR